MTPTPAELRELAQELNLIANDARIIFKFERVIKCASAALLACAEREEARAVATIDRTGTDR